MFTFQQEDIDSKSLGKVIISCKVSAVEKKKAEKQMGDIMVSVHFKSCGLWKAHWEGVI